MPKITPHPHVNWRNGRPRFDPSPTLRKQGHASRDLRHEDGSWFSKGEAVDWSIRFQKQLATAARAKAEPKPSKARGIVVPAAGKRQAPAAGITVAQLHEDWTSPVRGSLKFRDAAEPGMRGSVYAAGSRRDIKQKLGLIEEDHPDFWASPVDAITQPVMFGLYEELVAKRGLSQARSAVAWLSVMFSWGRKRGKCAFLLNQGRNPCKELGMTTPPPRIRFGTRAEINALIAAADKLGWPEIGDMIVLGVWTGQRQADRLQMVDKGTLGGRRVFRQAKTGAIVAVMESPELTARLKASTERRRAADIVNPRVVLDEAIWQAYPDDGDRYRKRFAQVRAEAGKHVPSLIGKGRNDVQPFFEADLRDTAVTWLALAGATIPEICAITGHTLDSATRILKHYLARHPEMADAAIAKMIEWYDGDGETEIGL